MHCVLGNGAFRCIACAPLMCLALTTCTTPHIRSCASLWRTPVCGVGAYVCVAACGCGNNGRLNPSKPPGTVPAVSPCVTWDAFSRWPAISCVQLGSLPLHLTQVAHGTGANGTVHRETEEQARCLLDTAMTIVSYQCRGAWRVGRMCDVMW